MPLNVSQIAYQPKDPRSYRPPIGMIGCGGITKHHLRAYRNAGYSVVALCDTDRAKAEQRRKEFFPEAKVYTDYRQLLQRDDVEVLDITPHPHQRLPIITAGLKSGRHVLSQKPFVLDLDEGLRLADLADQKGLTLAVNQNARWAPHFSFTRQAIADGVLGQIAAAHFSVHWDHGWVAGTEFEKVKHLILYDFAIHWFDMLTCCFSGRIAKRVYASTASSPNQPIRPHLLGQVGIEYDEGQASLVFDAFTKHGELETMWVSGTDGTISSRGIDSRRQQVSITTAAGTAEPQLSGQWFPDGFHGTMGELLCSIEENRTPSIDARSNLDSLALCFASVASAARGEPVIPGTVRSLPD